MADLMKGTTTFEDLITKYSNFMVPTIKIKVQGSDIVSSLKIAVEDVSIVLPLDSAGSCNFTIINAFDLEESSFSSAVTLKLKLGTIFEVELGYGSSTTMVFKGYISEINMNFSESPTLEVSGMDVRKLMMDGKERMVKHDVKNYSEAFTQIMDKYKKLCSSTDVDATDDQLGTNGVNQVKSDYKFIQNSLCKKAERKFFVLGDKAYFVKKDKYNSPIITLQWGLSLVSFSRRANYLDSEILVVGHDGDAGASFEGSAKATSSDPQSTLITQPNPTVILDPDATSESKAKQRAEIEANGIMSRNQSASGSCIGIPELVPGRYIKINKLGSGIKDKFYLVKVSHRFGSDGFTTNFDVEGWE